MKSHAKEVTYFHRKRNSKKGCECEITNTHTHAHTNNNSKKQKISTTIIITKCIETLIHIWKRTILTLSNTVSVPFSAFFFSRSCSRSDSHVHFRKSIFYLKNFLNHKSDLAIYSTFALHYGECMLLSAIFSIYFFLLFRGGCGGAVAFSAYFFFFFSVRPVLFWYNKHGM